MQGTFVNAKDILNADLPTILQWARRGFSWWLDELLQLLPATWRKRLFSSQPDIVLMIGGNNVTFYGRNGVLANPSALSRRERNNVKVVVPAEKVLRRAIELPLLPMSDIRRMLLLDIDRLTPFRGESVVFDTELIGRDTERGKTQILLGVMPRTTAMDVMSRVEALGVRPTAFGVASGPNASTVHFDFLPALGGGRGLLGGAVRLPYWWAAVGFLLLVNLGLLIYRDSSQLDSLQQIVDSQAGPVEIAMKLRNKVDAEAERRAALIDRIRKRSPLRILDAVTKALPPNAWTQTVEWNGQTVHLVGFSNGPADLLSALESSPTLHNARTMSRDTIPVKQTGMQPFDVSADVRKGAIR